MKTLVIGCGSIGRRHARNLQAAGVELVVCDLDDVRASTLAEELGGCRHYTDYRTAVQRERVVAAVIATPTSLHVPIAIDLAKRGIHFLVEKPLSHSLAGVEELLEVVWRSRVTAMMGYSFRFHEGLLTLRGLLDRAAIGRVYHVQYHSGWYLPDWHVHEDYRLEYAARKDMGGGVALTTLSHGFDIFHWFFGDIAEIIGWRTRLSPLDLDVEDSAFCLLRTRQGVVVNCVADFLSRFPRHEMVLLGEQGHIRADLVNHVIEVWKTSEKRFMPDMPVPARSGLIKVLEDGVTYDPQPTLVRYDFEGNRRYLAEVQHFLARVRAGDLEFDLDLRSGLRVLRLIHHLRFFSPPGPVSTQGANPIGGYGPIDMPELGSHENTAVPVLVIGDRRCSREDPALLIAEEGQANDGNFGLALRMVSIAAACGADGIEFQLAVADDLYVANHDGYRTYKRREFSDEQIRTLIRAAHDEGLLFHAACLSERLVSRVVTLGADCLVVNAMDLNNPRMLDAVAACGKPFFIATLMGTVEEIDWAVMRIRARAAAGFGLLHGQHVMTTRPGGVPVNYTQVDCITLLESRYGVTTGFVDHTDSEVMPAIAAARGASLITKHLAPDSGWRGPDWQVCLDPEGWARARAHLHYANAARGADKTLSLAELADRALHRRSIVAARPIPAGKILEADDIAFKRPGGGLDPALVDKYLGRRVRRSVTPDGILSLDMIED